LGLACTLVSQVLLFCRNHRPLEELQCLAEENRLVLGQTKVCEKADEISAMPQLLRWLELAGWSRLMRATRDGDCTLKALSP
jgi:hypothetical protein